MTKRWSRLGFACLLVVGCSSGLDGPDPSVEALLALTIEIEGLDGQIVSLQRMSSSREYEIGGALAFGRGSFDTPSHAMFGALRVFQSESEAIGSFQDGEILGRLSRSIVREPLDIEGADESVRLCIDQEEHGIEFCAFPHLLIRSGRFLINISGGREQDRLLLAKISVAHLLENTAEACETFDTEWCHP